MENCNGLNINDIDITNLSELAENAANLAVILGEVELESRSIINESN